MLIPHITRIAAVEPESRSSFNYYLVPHVTMAASAQQITGIVFSDSGSIIVNVEPAVHKIMTRIDSFPIVILVAHIGR